MSSTHSLATRPVNINAQLRRAEEMKLRIAGMNFREIRDAMIQRYGKDALPGSYDERFVWKDVQILLQQNHAMTQDAVTTMRTLESERLDQVQLAIMPQALSGNLKAINILLRIMDHRAKLHGLYAPSQMKVTDWRSEILDLIKTGVLTKEQVEQEIGPELSEQLFEQGSAGTVEGRFVEEQSEEGQEDSAGWKMARPSSA